MRLAIFPKRFSLRRQLIATYVAGLLIATAVVVVLVFATIGWDRHGLTVKGLKMQAQWIEQGLQFDAAGMPLAVVGDLNAPWVYRSAPDDVKYRVLDASGRVLLASEANASALVPHDRPFDPQRAMFEVNINGLQLYVLTVALPRPQQILYIQAARSERLDILARRTVMMPVLQVALGVELGSLLLFGLAVYFTLSNTLGALDKTSTAAARIAPDNLSARLDTEDLPAEMQPLVASFNLALGRLEHGYRVQQDFLAGAAHELKTPLALIRAQIELDDGQSRASLLRDVDLMARQVSQLLHLAEVSEAQNYVVASTDLTVVAGDVLEHLGRLAESHQVSLSLLTPNGPVHRRADRSAMFILMKNLVENAIRHSQAGAAVSLTVATDAVTVRDRGSGINEADAPHLFKRFWRGPNARGDGAGLGLAICQEIARVHGWQLAARNGQPGAVFSLIFQPA